MSNKPNYHQLLDGTPIPPEGIEGWASDSDHLPGSDGADSLYCTIVSCIDEKEFPFIASSGCSWKYFTPAPKPVLCVPDEFWPRVGTACAGVALIPYNNVYIYYGERPVFNDGNWDTGSCISLSNTPNHGIQILDPMRPQDSWVPNPYWEGEEGEVGE